MIKFLFFLYLSPATPQDKIMVCYELMKCEEINITTKIILYETGYFTSHKLKVDNAQKYGNIFGFRYKNRYLRFDSYAGSVRYYRDWQCRHWKPYKKRNPNKTYYDFLVWRGYCNGMRNYIKTIKRI